MTSSTVSSTRPARADTERAGQEAFWILRTAFTVAPILFGLDKFANVMTDWPKYLAGQFDDLIPGSAHLFEWDNPKAAVATLRGFLRDVDAGKALARR